MNGWKMLHSKCEKAPPSPAPSKYNGKWKEEEREVGGGQRGWRGRKKGEGREGRRLGAFRVYREREKHKKEKPKWTSLQPWGEAACGEGTSQNSARLDVKSLFCQREAQFCQHRKHWVFARLELLSSAGCSPQPEDGRLSFIALLSPC